MGEKKILDRLQELYSKSIDLRNKQYEAGMRCECWSQEVMRYAKEIKMNDEEINYLNFELLSIWNKKIKE